MIMRRLLFLLCGSVLYCGIAVAQNVVVIVNQNVKATTVTSYDIQAIFTGHATKLANGSRVDPVTLKSGPTYETFLKAYVGKTDAAFRANWRMLVFTGGAKMPKEFDNEASLLHYVKETPAAIGYVSKDTDLSGTKVLVVE